MWYTSRSKKRSHSLEAVMVASTGQAFEWNHTRCRFSPEIILDKVPLNWCRISYIHMIPIYVSLPCFGASPIRRCCCWPSEGSFAKSGQGTQSFYHLFMVWHVRAPRHGRGISQPPEVSPSQKGVSLSISPNGREPEDAKYRYPESPVDQTKWRVFRITHVKNSLLPRVKVWSLGFLGIYMYIII